MTLSFLVATLAQLLTLAILVRAILSWFPGSRGLVPVTGLLDTVTEPLLGPIRRRLPMVGGFDLSPLLALLLIALAASLLLGVLAGR
ncbi:MAG TPA: YggT family protein [Chloroflexota bacterium]|jgi:YggT family protein